MTRALLPLFAVLLAAASPAEESEHVVQEGETLNGIANRAGVRAQDIIRANGLTEPYIVRIGQKLTIPRERRANTPRGGTHIVGEGETLNGIANRAGVTPAALAKANGLEAPYIVRIGQNLVIPATGGKPTRSAAPASNSAEYIVKPGDTLGGIANRTGVARIVIAEANGLVEPYAIRTGQKLTIPRQRTHIVAAGETGFSIAYKYGVPFSEIATASGINENSVLKPGQKLLIPAVIAHPRSKPAEARPAAPPAESFLWPLSGAILTRFDSTDAGRGHNGIDIAASIGEPVKATKGGRVIYAGEEPVRYGNMIIIAHGGQWHSAYGHLSSIAVRQNASVSAGQIIGYAGSTGQANQPELHFELRHHNQPIDPLPKLQRGAP